MNGLSLPERHSSSYGFVAEFAADGRSVLYATLLGGGTFIPGTDGGFNYATGVAFDPSGDAYVAGVTKTIDFPTVNPFQGTNPMAANGVDAFVSKLVFSDTGVPTTTTTSTTIRGGATTTTTSPPRPCRTPRCILDSIGTSAVCTGQTIPAAVTGKIAKAEGLIERAATAPARKAGKLLRKAERALAQAGAKALHAARGRKPKISTACAVTVRDAANRVAASLRR